MPLELKHSLIIEDDRGRREYILDASMYSIGRDLKCDIRIDSQYVSRRHATLVQLFADDGTFHYRIVDGLPKGKPSSNGLFVNGRRLPACDLNDRDEIKLGPKICATYRIRNFGQYTSPLMNFDDTVIPPQVPDIPSPVSDGRAYVVQL
jgi:pSer/pThr/pTyr-binding forkhead associated (FHA) protein